MCVCVCVGGGLNSFHDEYCHIENSHWLYNQVQPGTTRYNQVQPGTTRYNQVHWRYLQIDCYYNFYSNLIKTVEPARPAAMAL